MGKKLVKAMSVLQIVLSIVAYISMSIHFNDDKLVFAMLAHTDVIGTLLRLSLYVIPGIHLLSGLYGLVFNDKNILLVIIIFELISCGLTFTFIGRSQYMLILSIVSCVIALIYLFGALSIKKEIKNGN